MRLSEIDPTSALKSLLVDNGVTTTIYTGNKPTSGLPNEYIELLQNGGTQTDIIRMGRVTGFVLISVNVKHLSTGGRNTVKEKIVIQSFDELFADMKAVEKNGYIFQLEPDNLVYSGGGIYEGYSTRLINLTFRK